MILWPGNCNQANLLFKRLFVAPISALSAGLSKTCVLQLHTNFFTSEVSSAGISNWKAMFVVIPCYTIGEDTDPQFYHGVSHMSAYICASS